MSSGIARVRRAIRREIFEKRSRDSKLASSSDCEYLPEIARVEASFATARDSASRIPIAKINWVLIKKRNRSGMSTRELSTFPLSSLSSLHTLSLIDTYRIPFIASREFFKIAESRGAAIVHIAVTNPVVIKTTNTQPGTSPRSSRVLLNIALERSD
jgi:hypothetical protein